MDCIFCKIAAGEIPCKKVLEGEHFIAFDDIAPSAPVHTLVIPRKHVANLAEIEDEDVELLGRLMLAVRDVARKKGVAEAGFRTIANTRSHGGQEVFHLHIHVIGGRPLGRMLLGS